MGCDRVVVLTWFLILAVSLTIAYRLNPPRHTPYKNKPKVYIPYPGPIYIYRRPRLIHSYHQTHTDPRLVTILLNGVVHPNSKSVIYDRSRSSFSNAVYQDLNNSLCFNSKAAVVDRADIYKSWYDCTVFNGTNSGHVATAIRFKRKQLEEYGLNYASPTFHAAVVVELERNHSKPSTRSGFYYEKITDIENKSQLTVVRASKLMFTLLGLALSRICL
ncbi:hypothetical protein EG68_01638 [Paragonimus skrjabini miyazakii]|uniref:Uncharacterized protein n=1 Tax=Paragonimus skrjabini miyazakii TaxID=59628 RepID=A0A8S9ZA22_9TREM|nr:hypothetical protein EG68_01638 [Paragonimus skrjabini miyazakii]